MHEVIYSCEVSITPIFHEFKHLPKNLLAGKKQSRDLNQNTATPLTTIEARERKTNQVLHFPKGAPNSLGLGARALLVVSPASSAVSSRIFQARNLRQLLSAVICGRSMADTFKMT